MTISIYAFNNDKFLDSVKLLSKSVIGLQKINKRNKKRFGSRPAS